jgi:ERCC4-type nuclease
VITFLNKLCVVKVERITVGDYAFVYKGKVVVIVERKSLADLASSIKDGRMENNKKLLEAQENTGCKLVYMIEGTAYPRLDKKIGRMPYKCLQGKLDSLLFRHDIKIIWTRDCEHTAARLAGLRVTFEKMVGHGVFGGFTDTSDSTQQVDVIKKKHEIKVDHVHVLMLSSLKGISYKAAIAALKTYTIQQILLGETTPDVWYNMRHVDSNFKMGDRGIKMHKTCQCLRNSHDIQAVTLSKIKGLTYDSAQLIVKEVPFDSIVKCTFAPGAIANVKKNEKRRIGISLETYIRMVFTLKVDDAAAVGDKEESKQ